jgi:hypothetical protein
MSEIKSLDLTASVNDADGLNLTGRDIFPGKHFQAESMTVGNLMRIYSVFETQ